MDRLQKSRKILELVNKCVNEGCGPIAPHMAHNMRPPMPQHNQQLTYNQLNDPNFIARIVAQVIQQMKNLQGGMLQEQGMYIDDDEWEEEMGRDPKFGGLPMASKRDTSQDTRSGEFNTEVLINGQRTKVNVKYGHATGPLDDVTISWGNESHNVDFEEEDVIDDHGNEGKDMVFMAMSDDKRWIFMVDVSVGFNYENSGEIQNVDWVGSLEIDQADPNKIEI